MQDFIQKLTAIIQTALSESVQTVQKFIADDPIISARVVLVVILGGAAGWYFWNPGESRQGGVPGAGKKASHPEEAGRGEKSIT